MKPNDRDLVALRELDAAIRKDDLESVSRLIGAHPLLLHVKSPDTFLHLAARLGRLEVVQLLLNCGADINADIEGYCGTPLDRAASTGQLEVVRYLVERGASLAVPRPERNSLFSAIYGGHANVIRYLLEAGVNPHAVYRGETGLLKNALSFARDQGRDEIVDFLTQAGCRMPIEGVDEPLWEPWEIAAPTAVDEAREQIIVHLAEQFGPVDQFALKEIVPIHDDVHVAVNVIPPNELCPYLTLFTTGMSDMPMTVPEGQEHYRYAELVMHLPSDWPHPRDEAADSGMLWPVEWLRKLAYFPHWNETWLGGRYAIIASDDPPTRLGPNTKQTCLLLIADFADWSPLVLENGNVVHFYTVTSLYTEERDFENQHDMVSLLQRFQDRGQTAMIDVNRDNVALG